MYKDDGLITVEFDSKEDYLAVVESLDVKNVVFRPVEYAIYPLDWMVEIDENNADRLFKSISDVVSPLIVKLDDGFISKLHVFKYGFEICSSNSWLDIEYLCRDEIDEIKQLIRTRTYI